MIAVTVMTHERARILLAMIRVAVLGALSLDARGEDRRVTVTIAASESSHVFDNLSELSEPATNVTVTVSSRSRCVELPADRDVSYRSTDVS